MGRWFRRLALALGLLIPVYAVADITGGLGPGVNGAVSVLTQSVANVLLFAGSDPTGVADSTSAINSAAALVAGNARNKNVYLPAGDYRVTGQITLTNGQCLIGDSRGNTRIRVSSDFSSSATGVFFMTSGNQDPGPCLRYIGIIFAQPTTDVVTTTTQSSAAATNTITVASTANIAVNDSVTDATTTNAIPTGSLYTVTQIVGNVVTLSANIAGSGVGNGDSIHFGPSRTTFATLAGGCTVGLGGTGCKYPPAVASGSDSTRIQLDHVRISGAWDGISTNTHNTVFWLDDVEMSALDVGLSAGLTNGVKDFSHIKGFHFWDFDIPTTSLLYTNVYKDGNVYAAQFGEVDGLDVNGFTDFGGRISINSGSFWGHFTNLMLDNNNATLEITNCSFCQFSNVYATGASTGANSHCQIDMAGGLALFSNVRMTSSSTSICASGGTLQADTVRILAGASGGTAEVSVSGADATFTNTIVDGAFSISSGNLSIGGNSVLQPVGTTTKAVAQTGGTVTITGARIKPNTGAGAWTVPLFSQTAGVFRMTNAFFSGSSGDVGAFSLTDAAANLLANNQINNWGYTIPGTLGVYQPATVGWQPVTVYQSNASVAPGVNAETNFAAVKIPANLMCANCTLRLTMLWTFTNNADTKTALVRLNSTSGNTSANLVTSQAFTTAATAQLTLICRAPNSTSSVNCYVGGALSSPFGSTSAAPVSISVTTTSDWYVNINGSQTAFGTDLLTLAGYTVEVLHP